MNMTAYRNVITPALSELKMKEKLEALPSELKILRDDSKICNELLTNSYPFKNELYKSEIDV